MIRSLKSCRMNWPRDVSIFMDGFHLTWMTVTISMTGQLSMS